MIPDPTLYGATIPQRELPVTMPFIGQNLPMQTFPWQNVWQQFPWQNLLQWQGLPRFMPFQQGYGSLPYFQQGYGTHPYFQQQYGHAPFVPPYVPQSFYPMMQPFGWQRPF